MTLPEATPRATDVHELDEDHSSTSKTGPFIVGAVMLVIGIILLIQTFRIPGEGFDPQGPRFFPLCIVLAWLLLSVIYLATHIGKIIRTGKGEAAEKFSRMVPAAILVISLVVYALVLDSLGYLIATALFFVAAARVLGSRNWARDITVGVLLSAIVYFSFTQALGVRLPEGILGF
ncbi:tripartite tricarboxylate transporter TctB family protein [Arthrobacter globiformis]|uniref:tripartite tricarboxylate transporter TctB family protein n=1 Tax=Arthrobacter globiformis TaxID=1665 RepID=UPI000B41B0B8|nr:tripartite tricarboxylate transporter TctB family protein [Arthrobacter globiformis]